VVSIDMMAAAERASVRRARAYASRHPGTVGMPVVTRALDLASEYSRSPNETRTRLLWVLDARLPPPRCNQAVFDRAGRLLGFADLLDVEAGVVGEFDGADHRGAGRHTSDLAREERFRRVGLEVFRVTGLDLLHPERVVDRMRATRTRARWELDVQRRWTIRPPCWWEEPPTLDEILDRRDALWDFHRQMEREGPGRADGRNVWHQSGVLDGASRCAQRAE
jgi:very-short-patch-repair endonuclease